jgi:hypothetical protein
MLCLNDLWRKMAIDEAGNIAILLRGGRGRDPEAGTKGTWPFAGLLFDKVV